MRSCQATVIRDQRQFASRLRDPELQVWAPKQLCGESETLGHTRALIAPPPSASTFAGCLEILGGNQHVEGQSYLGFRPPMGICELPSLGLCSSLRPLQKDSTRVACAWLRLVMVKEVCLRGGKGLQLQSSKVRPNPGSGYCGNSRWAEHRDQRCLRHCSSVVFLKRGGNHVLHLVVGRYSCLPELWTNAG
jgi:hypothetical protein